MQRLTSKEKLVAGMVAHGFNTPDIAAMMGKGEQSIKNYASRLYQKLDLPDRPEVDRRVKLGVYLNCELFKIGLKETLNA